MLTPVPPQAANGESRENPALWREIHEQPAAAERTLAALEAGMPGRLAVLRKRPALHGQRILLIGSGTSRHAAEIASGWFGEAGLSASVSPAGEIHGPLREHRCDGALIAVTQSGATGSVLRLLDRAGDEGIFRVVVTNEAESPAVRRADLAYVTRAGTETAIPATKSFTSALLALRWFGREWTAGPAGEPPGLRETSEIPTLLQRAIDHGPRVDRFVRGIAADRTWFFLGCGPLLPLAAEGALKMMETAVVPAIALRTEELVHGPFALVDRETPVVLLSEPGGVSPGETRALEALAEAGAPLLRLATEESPDDGAVPASGDAIVSEGAPWLRPFETAPVLQLLAFFAGRRLGRDVDAPAGLRKAVRDD